MVHAPIVPDRDVVLRLPLQPHLQVVVLDDELHKPVEKVLALIVRQPVDPLDVVAHGEDGLPTRHGVGADDGVDGLEDLADVLGCAPRRGVHVEVVALGRLVEARLGVVPRQGVEEAAEGGRDAVVELVSRGPEGIAAGLGQLDEAEEGIVAGNGLEGDVRVPLAPAALATAVGALGEEAVFVELLGLLGRDDADFVVLAAEVAGCVGYRVDVQA